MTTINKHLWFQLSHKKLCFAQKHSLKKTNLYYHILFTAFMRSGYLKCSNDTPKPNIHKYKYKLQYNRNILNRLSTTTQIFIDQRSTFLSPVFFLFFFCGGKGEGEHTGKVRPETWDPEHHRWDPEPEIPILSSRIWDLGSGPLKQDVN